MTHQEFDKLQEEYFIALRNIGSTKGKEYSASNDRLANFKDEAKDMGVSPLVVAHIFFNKHMRAINSYIREGKEFSEEGIYGRFKDASLYLILMYAITVDLKKEKMKFFEKDLASGFSFPQMVQKPRDMDDIEIPRIKVNPKKLTDVIEQGNHVTIKCSLCYQKIEQEITYVKMYSGLYAHASCWDNAIGVKDDKTAERRIETKDSDVSAGGFSKT